MLPKECTWTADETYAAIVNDLYHRNDKVASEEWREAEIKRLFAEQGVEVEFQ